MFRVEMSDTALLKDSLQSISNVITEGVVQFTDDGVELVAADPAMVAMVDLRIAASAFDSFDCDGEEHIGVNIEELYSVLNRAGADDTVTLALNEEDSKLSITIQNHSTRNFSLALLNLDSSDIPSTEDLDFSVSADLQTSVLADAIGDAAVVGDAVTFRSNGDGIVVTSEGDRANTEFTIQEGTDGLIELEAAGNARSMFSLDYLNKIIGAKKLSDTVTLQLGEDFPMRIDFQVPDKLDLGFILAPRIEE